MVLRNFCVTSIKIRVISNPERCRRCAFIFSSCANILFGYSVPNLYTKHCKAFNPLEHERYRQEIYKFEEIIVRGRGSVEDVETGQGLDGRVIESQRGWEFPHPSRPSR